MKLLLVIGGNLEQSRRFIHEHQRSIDYHYHRVEVVVDGTSLVGQEGCETVLVGNYWTNSVYGGDLYRLLSARRITQLKEEDWLRRYRVDGKGWRLAVPDALKESTQTRASDPKVPAYNLAEDELQARLKKELKG